MRSEVKQNILNFATMLQSKPKRRINLKPEPFPRAEMTVPLERLRDLKSLIEWKELGLLHGALSHLNDKAKKREIKAIKVPGKRGWQMLPEWVEEYNNRWVISQRNVR